MPRRATVTRTYTVDFDEAFDGDIGAHVNTAIDKDEPEFQVHLIETKVVEVKFVDDKKNVENMVRYLKDVIGWWAGVGPVEVRNYPSDGSTQMLFKFNGTQFRVLVEAA